MTRSSNASFGSPSCSLFSDVKPDTIATHCPYCALQCGMYLVRASRGSRTIEVKGNPNFPVNEGGLCVKGWSAAATLGHADRLRAPLVRDREGRLIESSWHTALRRIADRIQVIQRKHGADAVGGPRRRIADQRESLPARQVRARRARHGEHRLQRPLLHVVGGGRRVEGVRPRSRAALSAGRHPPCGRRAARRQQRRRNDAAASCSTSKRSSVNGGKLIVVDPRRTPTAQWASGHLPLRPGSDAALANGLLHILVSRRPDRRALHQRAHRGLRGGAARLGVVLAGARGADHRRA